MVNNLSDSRSNNLEWLQSELDEAHATIRTLLRQIKKEQDRHSEISRAYTKTVANLVEAMRENTALNRECDVLRGRLQQESPDEELKIEGLDVHLTAPEVGAIRKAMARLHHPDAGGDSERMKLWNAVLDRLERDEGKKLSRK